MSANLETLARDLKWLGCSNEQVDPIRRAAKTKGLPSSVELRKIEVAANHGVSGYRLGLDAREIALSSMAGHSSVLSQLYLTGDAGFGDVRTVRGGLLSVFSYTSVGSGVLVGEEEKLVITIQDPGDDKELKAAMKRGFLIKIQAVAININVRSEDFADVDELITDGRGKRLAALSSGERPGTDEDYELARLLIDRIKGSEGYRQLRAKTSKTSV